MSKKPPRPRDYEVGKGKTPVETRFQPGQSGNPKGRPRKKPSPSPLLPIGNDADDTFIREIGRAYPVTDRGRESELPALDIVIRSQIASAIKGNTRAQQAVIQRAENISRRRAAETQEFLEMLEESKTRWRSECRSAEIGGRPRPVHYPDPEDMFYDAGRDRVAIFGPTSPEEVEDWRLAEAFQHLVTATGREIRRRLAAAELPPDLAARYEFEAGYWDRLAIEEGARFPAAALRREPNFDLHRWQQSTQDRLANPRGWDDVPLPFATMEVFVELWTGTSHEPILGKLLAGKLHDQYEAQGGGYVPWRITHTYPQEDRAADT
ncbi:DUF5681 domain-containing protein [Phenylobacterium sp.]|uniref:DUF5681 domain-containing protein n=1 Tax=Phenylobacterium sp. TaxID=1871053 RepID=UPI0025F5A15B|nr:DUF5681 domain-containing protein [Phenylobacterium sp.]MBX3483098.1 hypothetical protein [Phenylobacterium sp.]